MSLKYEPSSESLPISAKKLFSVQVARPFVWSALTPPPPGPPPPLSLSLPHSLSLALSLSRSLARPVKSKPSSALPGFVGGVRGGGEEGREREREDTSLTPSSPCMEMRPLTKRRISMGRVVTGAPLHGQEAEETRATLPRAAVSASLVLPGRGERERDREREREREHTRKCRLQALCEVTSPSFSTQVTDPLV